MYQKLSGRDVEMCTGISNSEEADSAPTADPLTNGTGYQKLSDKRFCFVLKLQTNSYFAFT